MENGNELLCPFGAGSCGWSCLDFHQVAHPNRVPNGPQRRLPDCTFAMADGGDEVREALDTAQVVETWPTAEPLLRAGAGKLSAALLRTMAQQINGAYLFPAVLQLVIWPAASSVYRNWLAPACSLFWFAASTAESCVLTQLVTAADREYEDVKTSVTDMKEFFDAVATTGEHTECHVQGMTGLPCERPVRTFVAEKVGASKQMATEDFATCAACRPCAGSVYHTARGS